MLRTTKLFKTGSMFVILIPAVFFSVFSRSKIANQPQTPLGGEEVAVASWNGKIWSYPAMNAWGEVVLIPQIHRYPGTSVADQRNDSAEIAQRQIRQVLPELMNKYATDIVMVEGYEFGEVAPEKITRLGELIRARDKLALRSDELKTASHVANVDKRCLADVMEGVATRLVAADRIIALRGAPLWLKAQGAELKLYGSENAETRAESAALVRKYLYLQDQLNALQKTAKLESSVLDTAFSESALQELVKLFGASIDKLGRSLALLERQAQSSDESQVIEAIRRLKQALESLDGLSKEEQSSILPARSRSDNPYRKVTSRSDLQRMMTDVEKEIDRVVVFKRSEETADYMSRLLRQAGKTSAILQYGAGHEESLVAAFNGLGLSVIVAMPEEVARRQAAET